MDNLRLIDYSPADCKALAKLRDRLHQIYSQDLEETALALIDLLAKLNRPYLTALEEKLLGVLESEYGLKPKPDGLRQRTWSNLLMSFGRELGGGGD